MRTIVCFFGIIFLIAFSANRANAQCSLCHNLASELVVNSDFEAGNTGFSSGYNFCVSSGCLEGTYTINSNPAISNGAFTGVDHTTGSGQYMIVNGSGTPNTSVWSETITVTPSTAYLFSCWVCSVFPGSPAILQFSINGNLVGSVFNAPSSTGVWMNFCTLWDAGSATSAVISIVNQNTAAGGNDFGLDDISFGTASTLSVTFDLNTSFCSIDLPSKISATPTGGLFSGAGVTDTIFDPSSVSLGQHYIIYTTTNVACPLSDSIPVDVKDCTEELIIPNVFTPNSDSVNDIFNIHNIGFSTYHLQIFNRWGLLMFETSDRAVHWNGKVHGSGDNAPDGTYFYLLDLTNRKEELKSYQGHLSLLR